MGYPCIGMSYVLLWDILVHFPCNILQDVHILISIVADIPWDALLRQGYPLFLTGCLHFLHEYPMGYPMGYRLFSFFGGQFVPAAFLNNLLLSILCYAATHTNFTHRAHTIRAHIHSLKTSQRL